MGAQRLMQLDLVLLAGISATAAAITGLLTIWNFFQSPAKKNADDLSSFRKEAAAAIDELDDRLVLLEKGVGTIEATLASLPTKDSLHDLQMVLERVNSDVRVMGETLKGVKETSNLMRDWLLEKGVK